MEVATGLDPQPIHIDMYVWGTPEKLEPDAGHLIDAQGAGARARLLALLMRNAGLRSVVALAPRALWKAALDGEGGAQRSGG